MEAGINKSRGLTFLSPVIYRRVKLAALSLAILALALAVSYQAGLAESAGQILLPYLTAADDLHEEKSFDAVYILGGGQESLEAKFKALAPLYADGRCRNIMILSRPGTTEYSRDLGRNLTNDEWSFLTLEKYGVSGRYVQAVKVDQGFFGTFSESRCIAEMAEEKGWKDLLLITCPHHTRRVRACFDYFLDGWAGNFLVAASEHKAGIPELLVELLKLKVYQAFLLK